MVFQENHFKFSFYLIFGIDNYYYHEIMSSKLLKTCKYLSLN